jgi:hypothetical protein
MGKILLKINLHSNTKHIIKNEVEVKKSSFNLIELNLFNKMIYNRRN